MFASVLFGQSDTSKGVAAPPGSAYNLESDGLYAIYQVLAEQNMAQRWELSYDHLAETDGPLLIWQPAELSPAEWDQLYDWVAAGHTALLAIAGADEPGETGLPARIAEAPAGETFSALPAAVHPALAGVSTVAVGNAGFALERGKPVLVGLERPDGTPVLISWPVGEGRMYWSADTEWLSNLRIGQESNLELALGVLTPALGQKTAFDEYHHGYQSADRWWQLLRGPLQLFLLQFMVALALFYWAYGVRFGAPRPLPESPPRAAAEYLYSMSHLYRRARARTVAVEALQRSLTRELGRVTGGIRGLTNAEIARRVADQTGLDADRVQAALNQADRMRQQRPSEKALIALAREVEAIQRGVRNAGYQDQREP